MMYAIVWASKGGNTEQAGKAIAQALAAHGGFAAKAARALKTTPRVVAYKARKYGLQAFKAKQRKKTG